MSSLSQMPQEMAGLAPSGGTRLVASASSGVSILRTMRDDLDSPISALNPSPLSPQTRPPAPPCPPQAQGGDLGRGRILLPPSSLRALALGIAALSALAFSPPARAGQAVSVQAAVEKQEVYAGEAFLFQIQIQGSNQAAEPDLGELPGFKVEALGGEDRSSNSVTIINGRVMKNERRAYIYSYRLTATRPGSFTIPAITVRVAGADHATRPVPILALAPAETEDIKLRASLSSPSCYVGQPVTITYTWYIARDIDSYDFTLPILDDQRFFVGLRNPEVNQRNARNYMLIETAGKEIVARKGDGRLDGRAYTAIAFSLLVIPRLAGACAIPPATVAGKAVMGRSQRRDPLGDFFGQGFPFGRRSREDLRPFMVPANELALTVQPLPRQGRPASFTGLVGVYSIAASAEPTRVSVGEPITLTVQVTGPDYLDNVALPALEAQPGMAENFRIPKEAAAGKLEGHVKTFTQTLRASHAGVSAIPAIELPYFDAEKGAYAIARSEPIPLEVADARVVTADDAEGRVVAAVNSAALQTWQEGIAHNYEDLSVLDDRSFGPQLWLRSPGWLGVLLLPPLVYLLAFSITACVRRRNADPGALLARQAYGRFKRELADLRRGSLHESAVHAALRSYFGARLGLAPEALTFGDVDSQLAGCGLPAEMRTRLRQLFAACEASSYAAGTRVADPQALARDAEELVREANRMMR